MGKKPQAPWGYQCPWQDACPHLEGMSTHWMWARHQEDIWQNHDLRRQVDQLCLVCREQERTIRQLEKEKAALKAQLDALHRKQFKANSSSEPSPPADEAAPSREKKKRGAPKGHPPWTRRAPAHVDRRIEVPAPGKCPRCECRQLLPFKEHCQHLQEDIVLRPRTQVTCFDHQQAWCPVCERPVLQAGEGELMGSYIGPVAKSAAVYLHQAIGMSIRNVQKIMTQMFGLSMVPASVLGFEKALCAKGRDLYEDLHRKIQASAYLHADETTWRVNGRTHWLWYAGHNELAYFHIDPHRSSEAARAVIGPDFGGVLNTDDLASYNGVPARARQSCLAHPLRAAREALERIKTLQDGAAAVDELSQRFIDKARRFLTEACQTGRKLRETPLPARKAGSLKEHFLRRLRRMCALELSWEPAERLRGRLKKQGKNLLTFIDHPEVEPTNNQAEQSLRRSVIMRKVTFGNRSEAGAKRQAMLSSLILTAQRQERDPCAALACLLTQPPALAQAAFYRQPTPRKRTRRKKKSASVSAKGRDPP
jgi:transposase